MSVSESEMYPDQECMVPDLEIVFSLSIVHVPRSRVYTSWYGMGGGGGVLRERVYFPI